MYEWTGDRDYIAHPDFERFFSLTLNEYIARWDRDGDGLPDRIVEEGRRGIPSYKENEFARHHYRQGSDLLAVMGRAHKAYAAMCRELGRTEQAERYDKRGEALLQKLNEEWYDEARGYPVAIGLDGQWIFSETPVSGSCMLYWDTVPDTARAAALLDGMEARLDSVQIEGLSHYPELFWRYGRPQKAMDTLRMLMDPACPRKEYPEASYCAIGAIATGLMGICPTVTARDVADGRRIRTLSGLTDIEWVELRQTPVLDGYLNVRHKGHEETTVSWEEGKDVVWRAMFHGEGRIFENEREIPSCQEKDPFTGERVTYADITLRAGDETTVRFA